MSTRSLTVVLDDERRCLASIYRHCDGYPDPGGQGEAIYKFFAQEDKEKSFEMAFSASHFVAYLCETSERNIYLYPCETWDRKLDLNEIIHEVLFPLSVNYGCEYLYVVSEGDRAEKVHVDVVNYDGEQIYCGNVANMKTRFGY